MLKQKLVEKEHEVRFGQKIDSSLIILTRSLSNLLDYEWELLTSDMIFMSRHFSNSNWEV